MTALFFVQKVILSIILPPASLLLLVLLGLGLKRKKKTRSGSVCIATGLALLCLFSLSPVASRLMAPLEGEHPPLGESQKAVDAVVVLTGGTKQIGLFSIGAVPDNEAMVRLVEGRYQHQRYQDAPLIICGGKADPSQPHLSSGAAMAAQAIKLGVDPARMVVEDTSFNTREGAREVKKVLRSSHGGKPHIVLVTSAFHMGRAMRFFQQEGFTVDAAPAGYKSQDKDFSLTQMIPSAYALAVSTTAIYEYCVRSWYFLIGTS